MDRRSFFATLFGGLFAACAGDAKASRPYPPCPTYPKAIHRRTAQEWQEFVELHRQRAEEDAGRYKRGIFFIGV